MKRREEATNDVAKRMKESNKENEKGTVRIARAKA